MDETLPPRLEYLVSSILDYFNGGDWPQALELWLTADIENDERVIIWNFFDSKQRAWLKGEDRLYIKEFLYGTVENSSGMAGVPSVGSRQSKESPSGTRSNSQSDSEAINKSGISSSAFDKEKNKDSN